MLYNGAMDKLKSAFITEQANRNALQSHVPQSAAPATPLQSPLPLPVKKIGAWCERPGHTEDTCYARQALSAWELMLLKGARDLEVNP